MSESASNVRLARLRRRRKVLRAFNGAGLGVLLGGLIGALLGGATLAMLLPKNPAEDTLGLGALYGSFPGMFGGFWIGMTAVMRDGVRGVVAGTMAGIGAGLIYAIVLANWDVSGSFIYAVFTVPCGAIGGLVLSLLIRGIRARWGWWTRWEE